MCATKIRPHMVIPRPDKKGYCRTCAFKEGVGNDTVDLRVPASVTRKANHSQALIGFAAERIVCALLHRIPEVSSAARLCIAQLPHLVQMGRMFSPTDSGLEHPFRFHQRPSWYGSVCSPVHGAHIWGNIKCPELASIMRLEGGPHLHT